MPIKAKVAAMNIPKMLARWKQYRRKWLALADDLEAIGDSDCDMFRKMAGELKQRIDHVAGGKPPPVPDAPMCEFFIQTEAFHESLRIADWNARQRRWERKDA